MATILNIDTSTNVGSVALSVNGNIVISRVSFEDRTHAVKTGVFVDEVISEAEQKGFKIDAVAICSGPGSYTGLRIGVSLAKGLCYGFNIPLIAIDSLTVMAYTISKKQDLPENALLCPMIDARRMEVYYALYNYKLNVLKETSAEIINEDSFSDTHDNPLYIFGDGAKKCHSVLERPNVHYIPNINPMAVFLAPLAELAFNAGKFENLAYFEPFYLKNFVATISRKNVLG